MVMVISCARGCLPGVVPYRATGLSSHRHAWSRRKRLPGKGLFRTSCGHGPPWPCSCLNNRWGPAARRRSGGSSLRVRCAVGDTGGPRAIVPWTTSRDEAARRIFPPLAHALVKAVACALVAETKPPLRRQSLADVPARVRTVLGPPSSRSTVWRILAPEAIQPGRYKDWIFPRDPHCAAKAGPSLALYAGLWHGAPLGPKDHILSAAEQTRIQARRRCHPALPPAPGRAASIEHEYARQGARQYLAAWDVRRGYGMGRCEARTGIAPLGRLGKQGLAEEPYRAGERLLWGVDNGASHRGAASKKRLRQVDARLILVHTPVHARWLKQVEISFAIIQRKGLTPNDFAALAALRLRLALSEELSHQHPLPFQWKCDRTTLPAM
jgi:hypothetical protein